MLMRKVQYLVAILIPIFLGSCAHVYFDEPQTLGGTELDKVPTELHGEWNDGEEGLMIDAFGWVDIGLQTDPMTNTVDSTFRRINLSDSIRFYQSGKIYLLNLSENLVDWEVAVIKIRRGNIYIYSSSNPRLYRKDKGLRLVNLTYDGDFIENPEGDGYTPEAIEFNSFKDIVPDSLEFSHANFSGQMTRKGLRQLMKKKNLLVILKSNGEMITPDSED